MCEHNIHTCPWCNATATILDFEHPDKGSCHYVSCSRCHASGPEETSPDIAIAKWNSIPREQQPQQYWQDVPIPMRKGDYAGKFLRLSEQPPAIHTYYREYLPKPDSVVRIARRLNAYETMSTADDISSWGKVRALKLEYKCPTCDLTHRCYIPENWIDDGRAVFVENREQPQQES